ncbi:MAG: Na+/H+ antiporter subunit E, partial [Erysipelotrichaceae bacterium]|nr:Na+/H+ antiporter subunit E [Erysipelotrichaceae bacterium]
MLNKIIPIAGLTGFFLILAERITLEAIVIGGFLSWLVLYAQRAGRPKEPYTGKPMFAPVLWLLWIKLIAVLTREIVLSNVQVAKIVLSPKMLIETKIHHYVTRL